MFLGRRTWPSHGGGSSPALATWTDLNGTSTLVMAWCASDGTIYFASGMEHTGGLAATPLEQNYTYQRLALTQFEDRLVLAYSGTSLPSQTWCALSLNGETFSHGQLWTIDSSNLSGIIGGPAAVQVGPTLRMAWTHELDQILHYGFSLNPPWM